MLSSRVHFLCCCLWFVWLLRRSLVYLKKEQPTFAGCFSKIPYWLSGEHLSIMTPEPVFWIPRCVMLWFLIFIMGTILWLYQTQGLLKICAPVTDVTEYSLSKRTYKQVIKKEFGYFFLINTHHPYRWVAVASC